MYRYRWEGRCLRLKTSTFKRCHIICQLGSGPDDVDGVKAMYLEPTFRPSYSQVGRGHRLSNVIYMTRFVVQNKRQKRVWYKCYWTRSMSREIFGHNWSRCSSFLSIIVHLPIDIFQFFFKECLIPYSKFIDNFLTMS